jgi:hypothetical protein
VGHELTGLDPLDRVLHQAAKLPSLFVGDGGLQVLDLDQSLAHEDDLGDVRDAGDPGVADQLRIEGGGLKVIKPKRFLELCEAALNLIALQGYGVYIRTAA